MLVYFAEQFAGKRISEKGIQDQLQRAKIPTHVAEPMSKKVGPTVGACISHCLRRFYKSSSGKRMNPDVFRIGKAKAGRPEAAGTKVAMPEETHDSQGSAHSSLPPDAE
eukprot:1879643-Amphidinium_carterae.1